MPFKKETIREISSYVAAHLPEGEFYKNYFWFISDLPLRTRLEDEYKAARYIYKLLEGMQVQDELRVAQCKIQILLYASIYEAVLHHVLLQDYSSTSEVKDLTKYDKKIPINISQEIKNRIQKSYNPAGRISVYEDKDGTLDERKIVFEDKAETAKRLGLINQKIKDVICDVYSMRNAIHLHAEIRRGVNYDLKAAQKAYWHLQGFAEQIGDKMEKDFKVVRPIVLSPSMSKKKKIPKARQSWVRRIFAWCFSK